ncbi:beta-glucosidase [Lindgomyces ingoldianus]|uniref:Beta-glucosidase n=1 Tax=Lindgomyces ingoldianus TaxID=673940 RepID=A0ACB6QJ07_9PLEO|nr:beta-glucosidase [Lindgomyces ingoldianus]KAF2466875.1 beta-glucosidase [Lindgomyces ingoldianus]
MRQTFALLASLAAMALCGANSHRHYSRGINTNRTTNLDWDAARSKAIAFVAQLNNLEKVNLVTGGFDVGPCIGNIGPVERLSFKGYCMSDGPAGVNRADLVSIFPSGITAAATWDRQLMYDRGFAIGEEFKEKGIHVMLGPSTGPMGRHPLGGRNWEGFGPDPYLSGVSIAATVHGAQENGVQTCSKHFIANEQETQRSQTVSDRDVTEAISSNVDDRTLHELYLWPFAEAIKAGTASIMCSYNRINSTYACENPELLEQLLRKELGFRGYVVSDWFATHSTVGSANAGLDVEMPGRMIKIGNLLPANAPIYFGENLLQAVAGGNVSMERLDEMVIRVLSPYFVLGQDKNYPSIDPSAFAVLAAHEFGFPTIEALNYSLNDVWGRDVRGNHAGLIRKIGAAGTVLLKNVNDTLPLKALKNIAVFGNDAADILDGQSNPPTGYDVGTVYIGGGSGRIRPEDPVSPLAAIKERAKKDGARVKAITNNTLIANGIFTTIYPLPDVCLVFLKTYAAESQDRNSFELDHHSSTVVSNTASWCRNTVVITHSSGVNIMPWAYHPNVTAILAAHYPGEQSGNAIADVLWGDRAPSGHLPYTIPVTEADYGLPIVNLTNVADPKGWQSDFTEGQLIDYRRFDARNITPLYEFGFGLTYTTFGMGAKLTVRALMDNPRAVPDPPQSISVGGHPELWENLVEIETSVTNTGSRAGEAVAQLYLSFPKSGVPEGTPVKVLRGFEKISIKPGETKKVTFKLKRRDLSFWDVVKSTWALPVGDFTVKAGFSSRDLRAEARFALNGSTDI